MKKQTFGTYVRERRLKLRSKDAAFSLRRVAQRAGIEASFLSKIERGLAPPPSEARIQALAHVLGEDPDALLALAGKVSRDVQTVIRRRAPLLAELIRRLESAPDEFVTRIVRETRGKYGRKEK